MAKDYIEDALEALNVGATNLDQKTVAQINSMNIELKNADGSLAGRYTLSSFLENIIYTFLSTTKASPLASVLGVKGTVSLSSGTDLNDIKDTTKIYTCSSATIASTLLNCPVSVGFKMYVISVNTADISTAPRVAQVIIANFENGNVYIRKLLGSTTSNWYLHSGTVV